MRLESTAARHLERARVQATGFHGVQAVDYDLGRVEACRFVAHENGLSSAKSPHRTLVKFRDVAPYPQVQIRYRFQDFRPKIIDICRGGYIAAKARHFFIGGSHAAMDFRIARFGQIMDLLQAGVALKQIYHGLVFGEHIIELRSDDILPSHRAEVILAPTYDRAPVASRTLCIVSGAV